jgi:23S rRNA pseudouridine1911/1915/1917 synthase
LHVEVTGDSLLVTPDKHWLGHPVAALLEDKLMLPAGFVRRWIAEGRVLVGPQAVDADAVLAEARKIRLMGDVEEDYGVDASQLMTVGAAEVLYEDEHVLVANKPAGVIIYPSDPAETQTLAHMVARHYLEKGELRRVRHVHRLDKDTTGAILYAKHGYIARALDALLAERKIRRTYWAVVRGVPPQKAGEICLPIGRDRHVAGRYRVSKTGRYALTRYRVLCERPVADGKVSLLECKLETGRTHQIRVHLAAIGCPIVGDALYGGGSGVGKVRMRSGQALHAVRLAFYHPYEAADVQVDAPLPQAFAELLQELEIEV